MLDSQFSQSDGLQVCDQFMKPEKKMPLNWKEKRSNPSKENKK